MTQQDAAERLGISRPYVALIEAGRRQAGRHELALATLIAEQASLPSQRDADVALVLAALERTFDGLTETEICAALRRECVSRPRALAALKEAQRDGRIVRQRALAAGARRASWRYFLATNAPDDATKHWPASAFARRLAESPLSQAEVARRAGRSEATVTKWKQHGVPPASVPDLKEILDSPTGTDIRQALERAGWSYREFGVRAGVSPTAVSRWANDAPVSRPHRAAVWSAIAEALQSRERQRPTAHQALVADVGADSEGLTRSELIGWRRRYQLSASEAEEVIQQAIRAGQIHESAGPGERRSRRRDGRKTVRRLRLGRGAPVRTSSLRELRAELRDTRDRAEMTPAEAAAFLGISTQTYISRENGNAATPRWRLEGMLQDLRQTLDRPTPVDRKGDDIEAVLDAYPLISETALLEQRHEVAGRTVFIGASRRSREALARRIDEGRIVRYRVEHEKRGSSLGLVLTAAAPAAMSELLGSTLQDRRMEVGLLQREVAEAAGVPVGRVRNWESRDAVIPSRYHEPIEAALADASVLIAGRTDRRRLDTRERLFRLLERAPEGLSRAAIRNRLRHVGDVDQVIDEELARGHLQEVAPTPSESGRARTATRIACGPPIGGQPLPSESIDGERIAELRRRAGLSQGELGARLGVSQAWVSRWERGRPVPTARIPLLTEVLAELEQAPTSDRRLPRTGRASVAELVAETPGTTAGQLLARVNWRRRAALGRELDDACAAGDVERREVTRGGRTVIELHPRSARS